MTRSPGPSLGGYFGVAADHWAASALGMEEASAGVEDLVGRCMSGCRGWPVYGGRGQRRWRRRHLVTSGRPSRSEALCQAFYQRFEGRVDRFHSEPSDESRGHYRQPTCVVTEFREELCCDHTDHRSEDDAHQLSDSAINRALGELASRIPPKPEMAALGGAKERVRRGLETNRGVLLVDGVNLAAAKGRKNADALVSRFLRIRAAYPRRPVRMIVGYASSPGGLNGEAHMCEWIRARLTDQVFDVVTQNVEFQKAAAEAWRELRVEEQPGLGEMVGPRD